MADEIEEIERRLTAAQRCMIRTMQPGRWHWRGDPLPLLIGGPTIRMLRIKGLVETERHGLDGMAHHRLTELGQSVRLRTLTIG